MQQKSEVSFSAVCVMPALGVLRHRERPRPDGESFYSFLHHNKSRFIVFLSFSKKFYCFFKLFATFNLTEKPIKLAEVTSQE